jgi:formylglycine-generating enzyme required for sulfatase activity
MPSRPAISLVVAALSAASCERPRTEIVARVDSELAWGPGRAVQSVVVSVRRVDADGALRARRVTTLGATTLPLAVGVLPGDDPGAPVWIEALGCAAPDGCTAARAAVAQRAIVRFVAGQTLELPLVLTAACAGASCAADERCAAGGRCESATRAQATTRPFDGTATPVDATVTPVDATADVTSDVAADVPVDARPPTDAPVDARVDAAVDARVDAAVDARVDAAVDVVSPPDVAGDRGAAPVDLGSCPTGQGLCAGACRDLRSDPLHCGACDRACAAGQTCEASACVAPPPCPAGMQLIPAGRFDMGSAVSDEQPIHGVRLGAFCLDETEVTVAAWGACVTAGGCGPAGATATCNWGVGGRDAHPINCVDWAEARAYCQWRGGALPTEAQWEYAARVTQARTYPWGNEAPDAQLCWSGSAVLTGTCAVGTFSLGNSPFGLSDMAGNVWEWTADWKGPYSGSAGSYVDDPAGPASGTARVIRGGSWNNTLAGDVRAANRFELAPALRDVHVGVRCARAPR